MAKQWQIRRGTESENNNFTGALGEVTMDTTNNTLRVHDGVTQGGHVIGKATSSWNDITDKPSTFTPSPHTHTTSNITDFPVLANVATTGSYNDLSNKPTIPSTASDVSALPDTTKYGALIETSIDPSTFVLTINLKDQDGNILGNSQEIDLPLETIVVSGRYDSANKKVILTLVNGETIEFSIADLISGLQPEITSANKLDADLIQDGSVNVVVTADDKNNWNDKVDSEDLAVVATSGDYNDLSNKPTIPAAQVQTDWNATSGMGVILNKPSTFAPSAHDHTVSEITDFPALATVATSGSYQDLTDKPSIPSGQIQSNWEQTSDSEVDFIKNKPTIPTKTSDLTNDSGYLTNVAWNDIDNKPSTFTPSSHTHDVSDITNFPVLATVATSGSYNDLTDKPTLSTVATSGDYNDLSNKPSIPATASDVSALPDTTNYGASLSLSINDTTYVVTATLKDQNGNTLGTAQTIDLPLESVVVSGRYDSTNKKVILTLKDGSEIDFSVADLISGLQTEITSTNKLNADLIDDSTSTNKFVSSSDKTNWNSKVDASSLATVATSGSYNDLTDKPTIPSAQVNSDWNASSGVAQILNKPELATVATSGSYNDLSNKPTIPTVPTNVSAFNNDAGYLTTVAWNDIDNKPASFTPSSHTHTTSDITDFPTLSSVATSGDYNDLSNKPTIPAAQVQTDWNATTGMGVILNKPSTFTPSAHTHTVSEITDFPTLSTVATSGDYEDLSNTPTNFTGTDGTDAGTQGLVPAPAVTDANKYLKADGTWAIVESTVTSSIDCGVLQ